LLISDPSSIESHRSVTPEPQKRFLVREVLERVLSARRRVASFVASLTQAAVAMFTRSESSPWSASCLGQHSNVRMLLKMASDFVLHSLRYPFGIEQPFRTLSPHKSPHSLLSLFSAIGPTRRRA
jgi:hypothetical protein